MLNNKGPNTDPCGTPIELILVLYLFPDENYEKSLIDL